MGAAGAAGAPASLLNQEPTREQNEGKYLLNLILQISRDWAIDMKATSASEVIVLPLNNLLFLENNSEVKSKIKDSVAVYVRSRRKYLVNVWFHELRSQFYIISHTHSVPVRQAGGSRKHGERPAPPMYLTPRFEYVLEGRVESFVIFIVVLYSFVFVILH